MRAFGWIGVLTLLILATPAAALADGGAIDWGFQIHLTLDEREVITRYQDAAREYARSSIDLAARFPAPLLELQVRRDLSRLRWRISGEYPGALWSEALVCPEDRSVLAKVEGVMALGSARRSWIRMQIDGDRLLTLPEWEGRALLMRPDGQMVRLMVLEP